MMVKGRGYHRISGDSLMGIKRKIWGTGITRGKKDA